MIIWRGWGIAVVFIVGLFALGMEWLAEIAGVTQARMHEVPLLWWRQNLTIPGIMGPRANTESGTMFLKTRNRGLRWHVSHS